MHSHQTWWFAPRLAGLLLFLRAGPLDSRPRWQGLRAQCERGVRAARTVYERFFGRIMWRSERADVAAQLGLRTQHTHVLRLKFSNVETYYYGRQCARPARRPRTRTGCAVR